MASIQLDTKNRNAEMLVPYLLQIGIDDDVRPQGQDILRNWDFTQPAGLGSRRRTSTSSGGTCSR